MPTDVVPGFPISPQQQRVWSIQQSDRSRAYRAVCAVHIEGRLHTDEFLAALRVVVERHDILRTTFRSVPGATDAVQVVGDGIPTFHEDDLSSHDPREQAVEIDLLFQELLRQPFDFTNGPLLHLRLLALSADRSTLLIALPALCADKQSLTNLAQEIFDSYAYYQHGKALSVETMQYAHFSGWQNELLDSEETKLERGYWHKRRFSTDLKLPFERYSPGYASFEPLVHSTTVTNDTASKIEALARKYHVSVSAYMLACWHILFWNLTGQPDIPVGVAYDCRAYETLEHAIGLFATYLPLEYHLSANQRFLNVLQDIEEALQEMYDYQEYFDWRKRSELAAAAGAVHFFPICFDFHEQLSKYSVEDISFSFYREYVCLDRCKVKLACTHTDDAIIADLYYDPALLGEEDARRLADYFHVLLASAVDAPGSTIASLEMLSAAQRWQLLVEFNATSAAYSFDTCLHQLFEAQTERAPDAVALIFEASTNDERRPDERRTTKDAPTNDRQLPTADCQLHLTYGELNRRANQLARHLRSCGVEPEARVGVCAERSPELVAGLLGVLKAGAAYVPLDPDYPPERLSFILEDARATVLLTQQYLLARLPEHSARVVCLDADRAMIDQQRAENLCGEALSGNPAYVIYTSGSTGRPKGVLVEHRQCANTLLACQSQLRFTARDRVPCIASFSFDIALFELLSPLLAGGTSIMVTRQQALDLPRFAAILRDATFVHALPSLMRQLVSFVKQSGAQRQYRRLSRICIGGDLVPPQLVQEIQESFPAAQITILYGPTEGAIVCTHHPVAPGERVETYVIGRPFPNMVIHIVDQHHRPAPIGVPGELCIGGASLTRGYLGRPELTAERFVPNPFGKGSGVRGQESDRKNPDPDPRPLIPDPRLYRTSDLARYRPDGSIEFLGRNDQQVKVRGFRVELGEIEAVLERHAAVREAVVVTQPDASREQRLVAYVVPAEGTGDREQGTGVRSQETEVRSQSATGDNTSHRPSSTNDESDPSSFVLRPSSLVTELRSYLAAHLPDYMLPSVFVPLDALPLSPNGKVDRRALPQPGAGRPDFVETFAAPRTPLERLLAQVWADVLGLERVGIHDSFFALGGHSLLAILLTWRVREAFQVELPFRSLFEAPTVERLAAQIAALQSNEAGLRPPPLRPVERAGPLPLSFAQQRLWFLDRLTPNNAAYNVPATVRLRGSLKLAVLQRSLNEIVRRHEVLRTTFAMLGEQPAQVIAPTMRLPLSLIDLHALPGGLQEPLMLRLAADEAGRSFDLARGPVIRAGLIRLGARDHVILLNMHHIVSDAWSRGILVREVGALYAAFGAGQPSPLPKLPIQYADYAVWQRRWLQGRPLDEQLGYWRSQLVDLPTLELPTDRPRPPVETFSGAGCRVTLPPELGAGLSALSRQEGVTLFMTLLAAFQALLARYSGQDTIVVGTPIVNRDRAETEGLIGFFLNTLVLRADLSGNPTFRELASRVREVCLGAYAHQEVPFEDVVEALAPTRDLSRHPLFQVLFTLEHASRESIELADLALQPLMIADTTTKFDLSLALVEDAGGLVGTLVYSTDLFDSATITRMRRHLQSLLEAIVAGPNRRLAELGFLTPAERQQLLIEWNSLRDRGQGTKDRSRGEAYLAPTRLLTPDSSCFHQLFEAQAARTPDAVALVFDDATNDEQLVLSGGNERATNDRQLPTADCRLHLTYSELNCRANQLAHRLLRDGLAPEARVALYLPRSFDLVVGLLATLKAGGAYLPLDLSAPTARLAFMLDDAQVRLLVTATIDSQAKENERQGEGETSLLHICPSPALLVSRTVVDLRADAPAIAAEPGTNPGVSVASAQLAYVLYTSGSTGMPKGVLVQQQGLANYLRWCAQSYPLSAGHGAPLHTPLSFDLSVTSLLAPLCAGQTVALLPEADEGALAAALANGAGFGLVKLTPAHLALLIQQLAGTALTRLPHALVIGGEALPAALVAQWQQVAPRTALFNEYGPTEATVGCCVAALASAPPRDPLPIGRPIPGMRLYVLDRARQPAPIGIPGELYIGGAGLARGYLGRPDLTAERFVPNPFADFGFWILDFGLSCLIQNPKSKIQNGERLYKTGDLARYRPDGQLVFLGRRDRQIKLRGYRIELGEIEAALSQHPHVQTCVVLARADRPGELWLVAYVVPAEGTGDRGQGTVEGRTANEESDPSSFVLRPSSFVTELRSFLAARLPDYMLPSAFVALDALPLTPNGKIDHRALPAPSRARETGDAAFVAPRAGAEELLAQIWADVLGVAAVGAHDNYFALGGHSLLGIQIISRVRAVFAVELPLRSLFEAPTIAGLAERITRARASAPDFTPPPLVRAPRDGPLPLSFTQQRLWFFAQLQPASLAYNLPTAVRLHGSLAAGVLRSSLNDMVRRHESLRTTFPIIEERPVQMIAPAGPIRLPLIDLRRLPPGQREAVARQLAEAEARQPFDLARDPLLRVGLIRLAADAHIVLLTMHHIISDAWSMGVFVRELISLYGAHLAGRPAALPELPVQYADYAIWQRAWLQGEALAAPLAYWRSQLAGVPPLQLPTDYPRPPTPSLQGANLPFALPLALSAGLLELSRKANVTLFMTLLAAWKLLLARYSGQDDIAVGTPITNRTRIETEGLIGCLINTLVLRTQLGGAATFRELLARVREVCLAAYAHEEVPFEHVVDAVQPARDLSRHPLFQTLFVLQHAPFDASDGSGLALAPLPIERGTAQFDLSLFITETATELAAVLEYSTDLFEAPTITRMRHHLQSLLAAAVADPGRRLADLPLLTAPERQQILVEWNDTTPGARGQGSEDRTIHDLFAAQAARTPDAIAIVFEANDEGRTAKDEGRRTKDEGGRGGACPARTQHLTYRELNRRANQLAHYLRALGVRPEVHVGFCMERSPELIIAILGILKAGGAYLPLDPAYPSERIAFMLEDSGATVVLTAATEQESRRAGEREKATLPFSVSPVLPFSGTVVDLRSDWPAIARQCPHDHPSLASAANLAYVIYTSGSTGRPKGVAISHRSAVALVAWARTIFAPAQLAGVLAATSICFDLSIFELFVPLSTGGGVILAENALQLPRLRSASAVTLINTVPSAITELARLGAIPRTAQTINLAGEPLPAALVQQLYALPSIRQVYNLYGPSEDTTYSTAALMPRDRPPHIGRPIANTQVYLLDARMQLVEIGTPGELYLAGAGLARGYLNRPELTAERFVPNPFATNDVRCPEGAQTNDEARHLVTLSPCHLVRAGARLYKTGDLARYLPDGSIEYLGRIDHQVKIRGFRIEIGEIEARLGEHPAVRAAVVLAREDQPGDKRLVAYVVPTNHQQPTTDDQRPTTNNEESDSSFVLRPSSLANELRTFLKHHLPDYMIPASFVLLEAFPLTPNGKLDRKALPAPAAARPAQGDDFVAPRTPAEQLLAGIWADVLHLEQIGADDHFFALGGHSLLATQVIARVRALFQIELSIPDLFAAPTVAELAARIAARRQDEAPARITPIRAYEREQTAALSFSQQRLWFFEQLDPGTPTYNIAIAIHLSGALDENALAQSLDTIMRRHEALRTIFATSDGQPVQVVLPDLRAALPVIDLRLQTPANRAAATRQLMIAEARLPFDLARGPLLRATLLRLGAQEQILLLTMHHIVSDGWSLDVLFGELSALYAATVAGTQAALPELPIQYADFARWQREWLQGQVREAQMAYWRRQLGGRLPLLDLPTDRPRPARQTFRGAQQTIALAAGTVTALEALSRREGVTLFMALMSAFKILLHRYTGQTDVLVGTPIANRTHVETERLIGFFVNTLVLRTDLARRPTVRELLAQVREVALAAYTHQDLPFEMLVEALAPERDLSYNPVFQVMFVLQNMPASSVELPGLTWRREDIYNGTAKFDLWFAVEQRPGGLAGVLEYNADLFDASTIARMLGHFQTILGAIATDPGRMIASLPLLTGAEQRQILAEWNDTRSGDRGQRTGDRTIHQLFEAQAARTPDAIAVVFDASTDDERRMTNDERGTGGACPAPTHHLTYSELNRRANQLAQHLRALGVGPETLVGLCVERSVEMMIGLLGILKAGGAYLPLDPSFPAERLAFMLEDSGAGVLITNTLDDRRWTIDDLPQSRNGIVNRPSSIVNIAADWPMIATQPNTPPESGATADNLAYVIYTSGSTGRPKGVQIAHRAVLNLLESMRVRTGITARDALLAVTTLSFDIAALELFLPLAAGARVVIASRAIAADGARLGATMARAGITMMQATPSSWRLLLEAGWPGDSRLRILCGGEALPRELADRLRALSATVLNVYGPTETTIWSAAAPVEPGNGLLPIGRPIANTQIYLLNAQLQPTPIGVAGELYIGGTGLARGYLNRPELTAERFVPNPFTTNDERRTTNDEGTVSSNGYRLSAIGYRLYRTGDLARYRFDGSIVYLGRADQQIKLRGYRIELGEIEAALERHPAVQASAALVREDASPASGYPDRRLVAYIVQGSGIRGQESGASASETLTPDPRPLIPELRSFLKQSLPDYMLPSAFVLLDELPRTPNGKLDRKALPAPDLARHDADASFAAPRTPAEELLAAIWADVLRLERVGVHDHFFALGGHSLLATQVIARARAAFQVDLSVRTIFEAPTVAGMAERIASARQDAGPQQAALQPTPREGDLPLSFAQQRLWFLDQLNPTGAAYIIPSAIQLSGKLHAGALRRGLGELVRRHEALRTTFAMVDGRPVQVIGPADQAGVWAAPLPVIDLRALPEAEREDAARRHASAEARRPFDLERGPLMRAALLRLAETEHLLLVTIHHIIFDDWSLRIFLRELAALYASYAADQPAQLPALPIQYADFAAWQRAWLQDAPGAGQASPLQAQLDYWKHQLAGAPAVLELPADHPRPAIQSFNGAEYAFALPAALGPAVKALGRQAGATLFMTLLAAFQTLLYRYTGQTKIVVGSPIAGRTRAELEGLIGCFVNTLALHTDLAGNPHFDELLARVREVCLSAYAHQDLPFERLVEELRIERDLSRTPLFQVLFDLQTAPAADMALGELTMRYAEIESRSAKFDLSLVMWDRDDELAGVVLYNTDLFEAGTIRRMIGHFEALLAEVAARPAQPIATLPFLPDDERAELIETRNRTTAEYPRHASLPQLFEAQVERTPGATAAVFGEQRLSYRQLNARANQLAHHLRGLGVGRGTPVGICMERSLDLLVGLLGILKAGGAFVPLDPAFPAARMAYILEDAQVRVLVTNDATRGQGSGVRGQNSDLPAPDPRSPIPDPWNVIDLRADWPAIACAPAENPIAEIDGADLAYAIYTSGSTGRPKGVLIPHQGIVNYLVWCAEAYGAAHGRGAPVHASVAADAIFPSLFAPLIAGSAVVIFPEDQALEALSRALVSEGGFSFAKITPSQLEVLNHQLPRTDASGWIGALVVGAEPLRNEPLSYWRTHAPAMPIFNEYGPTETVVGCSAYRVPNGANLRGAAPIGLPIANLRFYVLDARMQPVPIGVPGELYIGGDGVAWGYLNRSDLTAERFVPNPFVLSEDERRKTKDEGLDSSFVIRPSSRLYRTGDLVRYLPDREANIEFLGRMDDQIKVRGYRVELGEIESALAQHPAVSEVVVLAREDRPGDKRLVAYIVPTNDERRTTNDEGADVTFVLRPSSFVTELRGFLKERLPEYMLPSAYVFLDTIPLAPHGKIDRHALPAPDLARPDDEAFVAPRTPAEETLAQIWREVLGVERVGIHDNFFALGGHSLLATQAMVRVRDAFQIDISLRTLFDAPNIAGLAEAIVQRQLELADDDALAALLAEIEDITAPDALAALSRQPISEEIYHD